MFVGRPCRLLAFCAALLVCAGTTASGQKAGMKAITADELRMHLSFVASDETEGRGTPSTGANIVARYLAAMSARAGLKPIMPDGSFFQDVQLNAGVISQSRSHLLLKGAGGESVFFLPEDFGGNVGHEGRTEGNVLFVGCGLLSPENGWNDYAGFEVKGRVVVALNGSLPKGHPLAGKSQGIARYAVPAGSGAAAVLTVISPERERDLQSRGTGLPTSSIVSLEEEYPTEVDSLPEGVLMSVGNQFPMWAEIRHATATRILGITEDELNAMFDSLAHGQQVPGRQVPSRVDLSVETDAGQERIHNVLALVEGSDPVLKKEYVVISAHYDHLGMRDGRPMNGANDNGSGTVAMLEIAKALMIQRPKRSVLLAWFAGEEKGLWGSHHFVNHCPVPIEAISADLNLDMIGRNDPDSLFLIGADSLSSELARLLLNLGEQSFGIRFKYDRTYKRRSDHYPFTRMGVPSVSLFAGATTDYHQAGDTIERIDFTKLEKVAQFAYAAVLEIGNRHQLLKLDANPQVTARGKQNVAVKSLR